MKRKFNLKRLKKDKRDYKYINRKLMAFKLPVSFSNKELIPFIYDQGSRGTCNSHGFVEMLEERRLFIKQPLYKLSRMFASYVTRMVEADGDPESPEMYKDNGASLRDTAKAMQKYGTVLEEQYPYKDDYAYFKQVPGVATGTPFNVFLATAQLQAISEYIFLDTVEQIKDAITKGHIVGVGIPVYTSFYELSKGSIYKPNKSKEDLYGGHFIVLHSYNNDEDAFEALNSWGIEFCDAGHFKVDYDFIQSSLSTYGAFIITLKQETFMVPNFVAATINRMRKLL